MATLITYFNRSFNPASVRYFQVIKGGSFGYAVEVKLIADNDPIIIEIPGGLTAAKAAYKILQRAIMENKSVDMVEVAADGPYLAEGRVRQWEKI